jgi:PAS domain S-box-containing protein
METVTPFAALRVVSPASTMSQPIAGKADPQERATSPAVDEALRNSEERFRRYFELGLVGMAITSPSRGLLELNDELCRILGYDRDELFGKTWSEMTHPDDLPADLVNFNRVMSGEIDGYSLDKRWIRKDGRVIESTISVRCVRGPDRSVEYFVALLRDVTEERRARQAARESEEWIRRLVEIMPAAVYACDIEGRITFFNRRAAELWGREPSPGGPERYCASNRQFDLDGTWRPSDQGPMANCVREGRAARDVLLLAERSNGARVIVSVNVAPLLDTDGRRTGAISVFEDVTERKRAEEALRLANTRVDLAVQASNIIIWEAESSDGTLANFVFERVSPVDRIDYELPARRSTYAATAESIHPDDRERVSRTLEAYLSGQTPEYEVEHRLRRGDGSYGWVLTRGLALRDAAGRTARLVGTTLDITDRKRAEEAIQRAKEAAEHANRLKDDFLAVVSHELRTPLAGILLWSQLLETRALNPEDEAQALRAIREGAQAQQYLIEDLLDVSRMLAGEMRLSAADIDLTSVVQAAVDIVRPSADAKTIEIEEVLERRASRAWADASRMQQVVLNLLNNAVKFTPDGGRITVRLRRLGGVVQIKVSDTGQGIGAEFLPHVFDRFRQADGSPARRHGGLGLGLAIARELVDLHGGAIQAESPGKGQGATFTVELPARQTEAEPAAAGPSRRPRDAQLRFVPTPVLKGVRALIVEDDETTRQVIRYLLEQCEAEVTTTGSALDALTVLLADGRLRRFDVLLSDVGLPEMSGHELIRRIRELERSTGAGPPMAAVALSAYARDEDRAEAMAAGFNAHLTKPVTAAALLRTVADCLGRPLGD